MPKESGREVDPEVDGEVVLEEMAGQGLQEDEGRIEMSRARLWLEATHRET